MIRLRIKEILDEQGHTKYWLRKQLDGIGYTNLSNLMNNEVRSIRLDTIDRLTNALNCTPGELFEKIDDLSQSNEK